MSITGGQKYFKENKSKTGSATSSVSGAASVSNILDSNMETYWRSVGSSDSITEEITITFSGSKTIDRILLVDMNWKEFNIQYDAGGVWTSFSSVVGLDGSTSGISETAFADTTAYYEFTSVTTGSIRIQVTKSQVVDAQKYLNQCICTEELGTFVGYPVVSGITLSRAQKNKMTLNGKFSVQKSLETLGYKLKFVDYPSLSAYNADVDLMLTLMDSEDPFLVWLCGGRRGTSYFKYPLPGFRLNDVKQMQIGKAYKMSYSKNIYVNQINISAVDLIEVI